MNSIADQVSQVSSFLFCLLFIYTLLIHITRWTIGCVLRSNHMTIFHIYIFMCSVLLLFEI